MGDIVLGFLKGRKEHIEKFKKWWFGPYKIHYSFPNNIVLFVNINMFEPNPILVNINKLKPYWLVTTIERGGEHKDDSKNKKDSKNKEDSRKDWWLYRKSD